MELVHEPIVQRGEIFQTIGAGLFEAFKEKHLSSWVELFKELAELSHRIAPGGHTQNIMDQSFDELLLHILAIKIAFGELP